MITKNERRAQNRFLSQNPRNWRSIVYVFPKGHRREVTYVISAGSILRWEMLLRVQTRGHS